MIERYKSENGFSLGSAFRFQSVPSRKMNPQLTDFEKGRIIGLREAGLSPKEVATRVGHDMSTVQWSWHQWIQEGVPNQSPDTVTARFPRVREDNECY